MLKDQRRTLARAAANLVISESRPAVLGMGVKPVIPSKQNEDRSKRKVEFDKELYRTRNIVERVIGWLKECRAVFSRFEKTAINYAGMVKMACIQRYFKILAQ